MNYLAQLDDATLGRVARFLRLEDRTALSATCRRIHAVTKNAEDLSSICRQRDAAKYGSTKLANYACRVYAAKDFYDGLMIALERGDWDLADHYYAMVRTHIDRFDVSAFWTKSTIAMLIYGRKASVPFADPMYADCIRFGQNAGMLGYLAFVGISANPELRPKHPSVIFLKTLSYCGSMYAQILAGSVLATYDERCVMTAMSYPDTVPYTIKALTALGKADQYRAIIAGAIQPTPERFVHITNYPTKCGSHVPATGHVAAQPYMCLAENCTHRAVPGKFYCGWCPRAMKVVRIIGPKGEIRADTAIPGVTAESAIVPVDSKTVVAYFTLGGPLGAPIFVAKRSHIHDLKSVATSIGITTEPIKRARTIPQNGRAIMRVKFVGRKLIDARAFIYAAN